jgi:hypothetical protein
MFRQSVWTTDLYAIDGTPNQLPSAASVSATLLTDKNGTSTVFLGYVDNNGFISVQSRAAKGDISLSSLGSFTAKVLVREGAGEPLFGLATIGNAGVPLIYAVVNQDILELSGATISAVSGITGNWSSTVV